MSISVAFFLIGGLVLLIAGAESLVRGASRIATAVGISPIVVGLTVVAFGTSSPELAIGIKSALAGQADLALGNVVGSNIFNILVIIGLSAVLVPLVVAQQLVRLDVPLLIILSILVYVLGLDGQISRLEGALFFAGAIVYTWFLIRQSRKEQPAVQEEYGAEFGKAASGRRGWLANLGLVAGGLALLVVGSNWLVDSATAIARAIGLSELVIGLTIVAVGTSMPEVATSLVAAKRGQTDIAVGNAVGSSILNILVVLALTAVVSPQGVAVSPEVMALDIPFMIAVAFAALPIFFTGYRIDRWEGVLFLAYYGAYMLYLFLEANQHKALPLYSAIMLLFVIPLTAITLIVLAMREVRARRAQSGAA